METDMSEYTLRDLIGFLDFLAEKGLLKKSTASSRKVAVNRLAEVLSEEEKSDIRRINIDDAMHRLHNKKPHDFTPNTLRVYKSRIESAINDFLSYKKNPAGFRPQVKRRTSTNMLAHKAEDQITYNKPAAKEIKVSDAQTVEIPVPIRDDTVVRLVGVPYDLTAKEARKIAAVIAALADVENDDS